MQPAKVIRQRGEGVAGEIEDFQRISQGKYFAGKFSQASRKIELFGASAEFTQAAQWAMGNTIRERRMPPQQIQARITRAPALKAALRSQVVHIDARQGMVGPAPQLTGADFVLAAQIADNENRDRRTIDAVVLSRSEASSEAAAWYREAAREARVAHDLTAGGTEWPAKAP